MGKTNKLLLVFLSVLVCLGCDANIPTPEVSTTGIPRPDGGTFDVIWDSGEIPRIEASHNTYTCYCRFQVPTECIPSPICGVPGSGTWVTRDSYCDVGTREVQVCLPDNLRHAALAPSFADIQDDCSGRIQDVLRDGLRTTFAWCPGVCQVRFGCSAIRNDNSIRSYQTDRCNQICPAIPLEWVNGGLNYEQATYIPGEYRVTCDGTSDFTDSPRVCAWR